MGIKRFHKHIDVVDQKLYKKILYSVKWMNSNKLTMNLEKTQCLLISTKSKLWKCKNLYIKVGVVILNSEGKG